MGKGTIESDFYIKQTTIPNDIVYDPFMGQGNFGKGKLDKIGAEITRYTYQECKKILDHSARYIQKFKPKSSEGKDGMILYNKYLQKK